MAAVYACMQAHARARARVCVGKKLELLNPDSDIVPKGQQISRKSSAWKGNKS